MIEIKSASNTEQIEQVRALLQEYQASLDVDLAFQGFAEEVAVLPGSYAPPGGRLLLAEVDGKPAGCIALQALTPEICEIKRLFVRPEHRGMGLGRLLVTQILEEARAIGYGQVYLDTLPSMSQAASIYVSFGFEEIPPYRFNPVPGARFMAIMF